VRPRADKDNAYNQSSFLTVIRLWTTILILLTFIYSCSDNTQHSDTHSGVTILTVGPRGGDYTDSTGKEFGFRIFRTHIINDTIIPIELTLNFPSDSVALPIDSITSLGITKSDRYVRVFLFPQTMAPAKKEEVYNYGVTGIESFLDTELSKAAILKITIQPKQNLTLYIGALLYPAFGQARAKLFINGQNLVYRISIEPPLDSALISCGQIVFKK
jgi:hypothetical protein